MRYICLYVIMQITRKYINAMISHLQG